MRSLLYLVFPPICCPVFLCQECFVFSKPLMIHIDAKLGVSDNNVFNQFFKTDLDSNHVLFQSQHIINNHVLHRQLERVDQPARFDIRPTLGELCPRLAPSAPEPLSQESTMISPSPRKSPLKSQSNPKRKRKGNAVTFWFLSSKMLSSSFTVEFAVIFQVL